MLERLTTLAEFLKTLPPEKFDLESWRCFTDLETGCKFEHDKGQLSNEELKITCGTTACAVGWACAIPEFNEQGLVWYNGSPATMDAQGQLLEQGWAAVAGFFGIKVSHSYKLFDSVCYDVNASPLDVALKIEKFIFKAEQRARNV